jgi:hypothetical protein
MSRLNVDGKSWVDYKTSLIDFFLDYLGSRAVTSPAATRQQNVSQKADSYDT